MAVAIAVAVGIVCSIIGWFAHKSWAYHRIQQVKRVCYDGIQSGYIMRYYILPINILSKKKKLVGCIGRGILAEIYDLYNLREFETLLKEKIDNCQEICIETIKREYYHQKDTTKPIYKEQIIKIEDICCLEKPFSEA